MAAGWGRTLGTAESVRPRHSQAWYIQNLRRDWPKRNVIGKKGDHRRSTRARIFVAVVQIRRLRDEIAAQREP